MQKLTSSWAAVEFSGVGHRDGSIIHLPGLYGFVRREAEHDCTLLFVGHAENISCDAAPHHPSWGEALSLGFNELQLNTRVTLRIDRLQLCDRIVRRVLPLLNLTGDWEDSGPCAQTGEVKHASPWRL